MKTIPYYHVDVFTSNPLSGNGLTVFTAAEGLTKTNMQRLTKEMRQFESIFLTSTDEKKLRAFVFTCEEELDFAGHPVLGAAAAGHELYHTNEQRAEWTFILNEKTVAVVTERNDNHYHAQMNQGGATFGKVLDKAETSMILDSINLNEDDLYPRCAPVVVSTGLPYLLIPLQHNLYKAKIVVSDLEERIKPWGAKFIGTLEIPSLRMRTWDNYGTVEDIATGSLAGPCGAYLVTNDFKKAGERIELIQGENLSRPSQLFVEVIKNAGKITDVFVGGNVCMVSAGILHHSLVARL